MTDALPPPARIGDDTASPQLAPAPDPLTVLVEVRAKPERQEAFLTELVATTKLREQEPGYLGAAVLYDSGDPARILIVENFASAQALQRHEALPGTREFLGGIQQYLTAAPIRTTWHPASQS